MMNIQIFSGFLAILAGILQLVAFGIYNKQIFKNQSAPNKSTWTLWVFLTVLNCTSYFFMTMDWAKSFLPIASSLACILTFFFALIKGKFSKIDGYDAGALLIGVGAGLIWWFYKSALYGNIILQFSVLISFIPTYKDVWRNSSAEKAPPWYIWTSGYAFSISVVIMRWEDQWQDLVYPINCLFLHLGIALLSNKQFLEKLRPN